MRSLVIAAVGLFATIVASGRAEAQAGKDFIADAQLFYRGVACGNDDPLPATVDAAVVDAHCKELRAKIERYQARFMTPASTFLATVRPAGLPTTVVSPFGGGDLVSA